MIFEQGNSQIQRREALNPKKIDYSCRIPVIAFIYGYTFEVLSKVFAIFATWEVSLNTSIFPIVWGTYTVLMMILSLYVFRYRKINYIFWFCVITIKLIIDVLILIALSIDISIVKANNDSNNLGTSDNQLQAIDDISKIKNVVIQNTRNSNQLLITLPLYVIQWCAKKTPFAKGEPPQFIKNF